MLLALGLTAIVGLWWLGRRGGRLPFGLTPKRLYGYGVFAVAAVLALRGNLILGGLVALAGIWLLEGPEAVGRRLSALTGRRRSGPDVRRTATAAFEIGAGGHPDDGLILVGPWAGQRLSAVPIQDLAAFAGLIGEGDPEGARLLQMYLDRRRSGWREDAERDRDARAGGPLHPGAMTEQEAYQVLGLERGASLEEIRAAHRALMKRLHPDQGGSAERAARVNAARDRLLDRHR